MSRRLEEGDLYKVYSTRMATYLCQKLHTIRGFRADNKNPGGAYCLFSWNERLERDLDEYTLQRERDKIRYIRRKASEKKQRKMERRDELDA